MDEFAELAFLLEQEQEQRKYNRLAYMYPAEGEFSRERYPKQMEMIRASGTYHDLSFFGGNGAGKSLLGAYMTAILATGRYPGWWDGFIVDGPIKAWVSGITKAEVRGSLQVYLIGDVAEKGDVALGTGMIPREDIIDVRFKQGTNKALDYVTVRNRMGEGGISIIRAKSYEEGEEAYQAENLEWAWQDEEPPLKIHSETAMRMRGRDGRVLTTCTPLKGETEFYRQCRDWQNANAKDGASRFSVTCGMDDIPHLNEAEKARMLAASPPWQRKARRFGLATVGTGLVYPVEETKYVIRPVRLEPHWRRGFGFDYGLHNTAFVYFAIDDDTDTVYVYKDYKDGDKPIVIHAAAMLSQGKWIKGVGDASAKDSDGAAVVAKYKQSGVDMALATKGPGSVMAGIEEVLERLETGRLKVFSTCTKLLEEIRSYAFDDKGAVKKENDHVLDALRYAINGGGLPRATTERRATTYTYQEPAFG